MAMAVVSKRGKAIVGETRGRSLEEAEKTGMGGGRGSHSTAGGNGVHSEKYTVTQVQTQ